MKKKLPDLYVNKIEKTLSNNIAMFYSAHKKESSKEDTNVEKVEAIVSNTNVREKIKEMFNSPTYVYKMDVTITLNDNRVINKGIIGQVGDRLLTIDDDLINIEDIKDINF